MRLAAALISVGLLLIRCGDDDGSSGSGFSEDAVAEALDLRFEGADNLYATPEGDCIVTQALTSSDVVEAAEEEGGLSEAVATNPDGTAGVVFGGVTSVDPDTCASVAEEDLANLTGD